MYLGGNIKLRREYIKTHEEVSTHPALLVKFLPEYVLPHLVHLLAHLKDYSNMDELINTSKK